MKLIILLFMLSFSAWADNDECTAAEAKYIVSNDIQKKLKMYTQYKKKPENNPNATLFEKLTFKTGLKVTLEQGGCDHFSREYSFVIDRKYKKPNDIKSILQVSLIKAKQIVDIGLKLPEVEVFKNLDMKNKNLDFYEHDEKFTVEIGDGDGFRTSYFEALELPNETIKVSFSESFAL